MPKVSISENAKSKLKHISLKRILVAGAIIFVGLQASRQIKLCIKAHELENVVNDYLSENYKKDENRSYHIAAHRGGLSFGEVENTFEAISAAAATSYVDEIEIDIRMTKDCHYVVSHDDIIYMLCETDNCDGFEIKEVSISNSYYSDLKDALFIYCNPFESAVGKDKIDYSLIHYRMHELRNKTFKLVELKDAIKACGDKKILLDLKCDSDWQTYAEGLLQILEPMWEQDSHNPSDFTLSSFSYDLAYFLKEHSESISSPTGSYATAIIINKEQNLDQRKDFDNVAIKYTLITDGKISLDELLAEGKDVTLWTENTVGTLRLIIKCVGDNWIYVTFVTNFPDTLAWEADRQYQKMIEKENGNNTYTTSSSEYPINNEPYIETSSNTSYRNSCKSPYKISDIGKPNYSMERYKTNHPKIMQNKPIRKQRR